jgi:hypothetical protein
MSDNLRQYRAIVHALKQGYPGQLQGQWARHVTTLAALISGIVASKSTPLPKIAAKVPAASKPESRVKRFTRWLGNEQITTERYFTPYAKVLLTHLACETLVLIIDGSVVGRGCVALMFHVLSRGRALPLAWVVRRGKKGHFPQDLHLALLTQVHDLVPAGAQVVVLGDGAFDGTGWQQALHEAGWSYVCRTGSHVTASWDGVSFRLATVGACIKPGTLVAFPEAFVTREGYGPILLLCCWAKGYRKSLCI